MLVKRSWCESRKWLKMPRLCHGTFPTFFPYCTPRVSSNLARSLDCSQDGSSGEVSPTGVGSCRVREEEAGVGGGGPPFLGHRGCNAAPRIEWRGLPAICARGVCSQGAGRRRWISHGSTLAGFPRQADAWKLTRTPGLWEAPGSQGDSHRGTDLHRRCLLRRAWRRGRFAPARREGGDPGQRPAPGGSAAPAALQLAAPPPLRRRGRRRPSIGRAGRPIPESPGEAAGGSSCGTPEQSGSVWGTASGRAAEAPPASRRRVPATPAAPRRASSEHLVVRPLLGARSGETECKKPPDPNSASSRRADHHDPLQQGPFLWALGRGQEQGTPGLGWGGTWGQSWEAGRRPGTETRAAGAALLPARLGWRASRIVDVRAGKGVRDSFCASPSCPRLQAQAPGRSAGFVPAPRAEASDGRWVPRLLESLSAVPWFQRRVRGCRTHPPGKGALLPGHSPLGGARRRGWGPSEQPPPSTPARAPGRPWTFTHSSPRAEFKAASKVGRLVGKLGPHCSSPLAGWETAERPQARALGPPEGREPARTLPGFRIPVPVATAFAARGDKA